MIYLNPSDPIAKIGFSNRAYNILRRNEINTIADLLACDRGSLPNIRSMGAKTVEEINAVIDSLIHETGDFRLHNIDESKGDIGSEAEIAEEPIPLFRDENGVLMEDVLIADMNLSNRSCNALEKAGYKFASQLIGMDKNALLAINKLGGNSANEVLLQVKNLNFEKANTNIPATAENEHCMAFVAEISKIIPIHGGKLYSHALPIFIQAQEDGRPAQMKELLGVAYLRDAIKEEILRLVSGTSFGVNLSEIIASFPGSLVPGSVMTTILEEMEQDNRIEIGDRIQPRRMTIYQYAQTIPDDIAIPPENRPKAARIFGASQGSAADAGQEGPLEGTDAGLRQKDRCIGPVFRGNGYKHRDRDIFLKRLKGQTLEEIGSQYGITRERVRQIIVKLVSKKPSAFAEDKYIGIFSKYDFSQKDFALAFGEDEGVYLYLMTVCEKGTLPPEDMLSDDSFPIEIRQKAEKVIYKNYISVGGERVHKSRVAFTDYVLRTYFRNEATLEEFMGIYNMLIDDLGLADDESLAINQRYYENRLGDLRICLWKQGRRLRYYDMESYDFMELWQVLALDQHQDIEYSALKFFRDYPDIMKRYDIRDEYELHNLLKKLCAKLGQEGINFGRMPMIAFGNANRDAQIMDMLINIAPVTVNGFAQAYSNEYGVQPGTFTGTFLKNFNVYFYDGMYDISRLPLAPAQFGQMAAVLTQDYYEINEIARIYQREFPGADVENINPYTIKTLGFNVYSSYAVKNTYLNAAEYFKDLLTKDDLIDTRGFPPGITAKGSYSAVLSALKSTYELIEHEPFCYINIRRLGSAGITVKHIESYVNAVAEEVMDGEFFTIRSLYKGGFSHELDEVGFGEVFYGSLLSVDAGFAYLRMGGTKLFRRGSSSLSLKEFLEFIIDREVSMDIYDLLEMLAQDYGLTMERHKIIEAVKSSPMHYDSISEKIYIDYDTYFEEV